MRKLKGLLGKVLLVTLSASMIITGANISTIKVSAASNYNYGDALSKSLLFYQLQESGKLSEETKSRTNWRDDSGLLDGSDFNLDLTGGWYDAGDNVKFNLPMAYSAMILGWSYLNNTDAYVKSNQEKWLLHNIEWANDYFVKCNPDANTYFYQVGDGNADHAFWAAPEVVEAKMERPAFKVDATSANGGSAVTGETAASLAVASIILKDKNPSKSATYLQHAKTLYAMAEKAQSDDGYTAANGFYNSWSGWNDELSLAASWLYKATGDETWLEKAKLYATKFGAEMQGGTDIAYSWTMAWDDVHLGADLLLADITGEKQYYKVIENNIDCWSGDLEGANPITITSGGLAFLSGWGSVRYACNEAFLCTLYADLDKATSTHKNKALKFAERTVNYVLGSSGQNYMVGYNSESPKNPHHRAAHGCWTNSLTGLPVQSRHTLVGAIVGGPGSASDSSYEDDRGNYQTNEVACDYNSGFTGAVAALYAKNGYGTVVDATAIEATDGKEFVINAGINCQDATNKINFVELKTVVENHTAWPARLTDNLTLRLYFDISDVIAQGYSASDMKISTTYQQHKIKISEMKATETAGIYYIDLDMTGAKIFPGGQSECKCEIQVRVSAPGKWDFSNSPCVMGLGGTSNNQMKAPTGVALFEGSKLVYGKEYAAGDTPVDPEPVDPEPVDPTPVDPTPVDPEPVDPTPVDPEPVDPTPVDPTPVDPTPVTGDVVTTYTVHNWGEEHQVVFNVTNKSNKATDTWEIKVKKADVGIKASWNVNIKEAGEYYVITPLEWNAVIQPGKSIEFGVQGTGACSEKPEVITNGKAAEVDPTPVDPEPVDPTPVDPTPVDPEPVDPEPVDPTPVDPEPVDPTPVDPEPVDPTPVDPVDNGLTAIAKINNWGTGYQVQIIVNNNTASAVKDWSLKIDKKDIDIDSSWNVNIKEANGYYVVTPMEWNNTIEAGKSFEFGVQGAGKIGASIKIITSGAVEPADPTPADPTPVDPTPVDPEPVDPTPVDPTPVDPTPIDPTPVKPPVNVTVNNDDWLHTDGSTIYDIYGNEVHLTGANWFGYNCSEKVFHGLWNANMKNVVVEMADHGINLVRVPISTELLLEWKAGKKVTPNVNYYANPELIKADGSEMDSKEIFDKFVELCKENGIKIMMDLHSLDANNSGHNYAVWYDVDGLTTEDWIEGWVWFVNEYKNDDTIIACDLKNEPHGQFSSADTKAAKWDDSKDVNNWAYAASRCGKAILDVNPNLLIVVEGIEETPRAGYDYNSGTQDPSAPADKLKYYGGWWGGNLRNAEKYPVDLGQYQSQLVYSPHDYGPLVHKQSWFNKDFTEQTLLDDVWYDSWFYIQDKNIAPLLIGEWGGFMDGGDNEKYLYLMSDFIAKNKINHTFWCINPNSGDTGGLLEYDWTTWDMEKYNMMKQTLWSDSKTGKFVGLDHVVPLGSNGETVTECYK